MAAQHEFPGDAIAIVGSACRFAGGVNSPSKLWDLLKNPQDVLSEIPLSRFNAAKFYHPDPLHSGTSNVRHSYLLGEDHRLFDAPFFGVKPVEAAAIDPQQRILLETTYEALEAAGIPMENIQNSNMGVYIGLMIEEYSKIVGVDLQNIPTYFASGTARNNISNRISYFFDLHGPSMTIDTACSSSLVALHQAILSLRSGESDSAIVGGANLILTPEQYVVSSKLNMLSPSGRSRMWDAKADGYGRGDGFGVLVVKTLSRALADGDGIECIIRGTGVNQDGRSKGLTMPNPRAQADLIRDTYQRAGLNLDEVTDRPQFFEAHGTGTPAGDPVEAEAISSVFFATGGVATDQNLQVGSVKTILGHTEGTAGILGIMKVSLAMKHGIVPPNMLLAHLSPSVQPFCKHLRIPQEAQDWPEVSQQSPRRASVNSFGFGGTNAHAIVESFTDGSATETTTDVSDDRLTMPFNFSAASISSLRSNLAAYASWLRSNRSVDLWDLSWTLNSRRSRHSLRISVSASDAEELAKKLEAASEDLDKSAVVVPTLRGKAPATHLRLLGVFTGQGAQWASMGMHLLETSSLVVSCFEALQEALDTLPSRYAPTWSLREEVCKDGATSRISQGVFSQPLCTAIQIALVQMLRAAGVTFTAVVGHSSGEIGAAYAAGYLSMGDAIRLAYFRGLFLDKAQPGKMLAAGTTLEDAQHLCNLRSMRRRICVAAVNSPSSVTLSGDQDAIQDALEIFEDEGKFARQLRVDKAYHSHHMAPIADEYVQALQSCGIQVQARKSDTNHTIWISSVTGQHIENIDLNTLRDTYWRDNMREPVLFYKAMECAIQSQGPFDVFLEIGPHPALKSPASDVIVAVTRRDQSIPYIATLFRGKNDAEAFASALGSLWTYGIPIELEAFRRRPPKLLKDLPTYSWNHDRVFWHETRRARAIRTKNGGNVPHPLLGTRCEDEGDGELRFRNYLHLRDLPWLADHRIQGQMVLPGSAYMVACLEAVMTAFPLPAQEVRLIEIRNLVILKALIFPEGLEGGEGGAEFLLSIKLTEETADHICATFQFSSSSDAMKEGTALAGNCSGELFVVRGRSEEENDEVELPPPSHLTLDGTSLNVQPSTFYDWARDLGYGYEGFFRGLSHIQRKINISVGRICVPQKDDLILHPATMDLAIQSVLLAYACPGDGRLRSMHMPTRIDLLRVDPIACRVAAQKELFFSSSVAATTDLVGHVELHDSARTLVQMQGLHATSVNPPTAENDTKLFFEMVLRPEMPMGSRPAFDPDHLETEHDLGIKAERVACFYLRRLGHLFPIDARKDLQWYHARLLEYVDCCLFKFVNGTHPYAQPEWMTDTEQDIDAILEQCSSIVDFKLMAAAGRTLPLAIRDKGETNIWEVLTRDGMLDDYYRHGQGMPEYLGAMTDIVDHLSHRFAHMDILEVGAGTGSATAAILDRLHSSFRSFTFTDISNGFFPDALAKFADFESQMEFRPLDIEKPVADQGFVEGSYDLVVASLCLHATKDLAETLANVRKLLRPGGYLVMLELVETDPLRVGLIFGGFPGWWLGTQGNGRQLSPCVSVETWQDLMQRTGFSKIDSIVPADRTLPAPLSVLVCQAVDERIDFLRNPLSFDAPKLGLECLTIIGGSELVSADFKATLATHYQSIRQVPSLAEIAVNELPAAGTVLSLLDADSEQDPVFKNFNELDFAAIQKIFRLSRTIIWISRGCLDDRPHSNMFRGLARSAKLEMSNVRVQTLDFDTNDSFQWQIAVRSLLQVEAYSLWAEETRLGNLLWQCEPELFVQNGVVLVPRLRQSTARNDRYNSTRRFISRDVSAATTSLRIKTEEGYPKVSEMLVSSNPFVPQLRITHSLLKAVPLGTQRGFLSVGMYQETGKYVLLFSESLSSHVYAPEDWTVPVAGGPAQGRKALILMQAQLLARAMVKAAMPMRRLVVVNPDAVLGDALLRLAAKEAIDLVMITTKRSGYRRGWTHVHPRETRQAIQQKLPSRSFSFVDMTAHKGHSEAIRCCLPRNCKQIESTHLFSNHAEMDVNMESSQDIANHLQTAYLACMSTDVELADLSSLQEFDLNSLSLLSNEVGDSQIVQAIVSWMSDKPIRIQMQPASHQILFRADRTYWLVGMTGGLGPGLCEFMASKGAAHIAISSRRPRMDSDWINSMAARGCQIHTFANDVTDLNSLRALHREIQDSMPPIAGVAQGAMVLHDAVLQDVSYSNLRETFAPKVDGSIYLDALFSENTLDFFVFFSSMAYVAGNRGQSSYSAANGFMASLAARRRKRGLAGSVMNMGGIVGEGYITRQLAMGKQSALIKAGFDFQSEQAFHELFSEAVLAGRPGSDESLDISSGLRVGEIQGVSFANNPIFQHQMAKTGTSATVSTMVLGKKSHVMIKAHLLEASSDEEVQDIISDGVLSKLASVLRVELNHSSAMQLSPDQLGIDSLVSVEIQSWLAQELGVDISVMRILNAVSIIELVNIAKDSLAPQKVPRLQTLSTCNNGEDLKQLPSTDVSVEQDTVADIETVSSLRSSITSWPEEAKAEISDLVLSPVVPEASTTMTQPDVGDSNTLSELHLERSIPMSFAQTRFWFLRHAIEDKAAFNVTTVVKLNGYIDKDRLARALVTVGQQHEAIRTAFYIDDTTKRPMQAVLSQSSLQLEHDTITEEEHIGQIVNEMRYHNFDLSAGKSLRLKLLSLSEDRHILVLGNHHIVLDGVGNQVFFSDLEKAYNGMLDTSSSAGLQYPDYTLRQLSDFERGRWDDHLAYWHGQFADIPSPLPLLDLSRQLLRPQTTKYASHSLKFQLDGALKSRIGDLSRHLGVQSFHFYLAIFRVLLFRYSNCRAEDFCIGVADSNRKDADLLRSLGLYLNLIPLRFRQAREQSFAETLQEVKRISDDAFTHSRVPIDVLLSQLNVPRSQSHPPLFQAFFNYQRNISDARTFCGCKATGELISGGETGYDVSMDIVDSNTRENTITILVNKGLYTANDARTLQRSYMSLLQEFVACSSVSLVLPPLHLDEDVNNAVRLGQGSEHSRSSWPSCVHHRIDLMVEKFRSKVALTDGAGYRLTYSEMAKRAHSVARRLQHLGIKRGCPVGLFQTPGPDWICSFLGILRAGACCVPLDLRMGPGRLTLICQDCKPQAILIDAQTRLEDEFLQCSEVQLVDVSDLPSSGDWNDLKPSQARGADAAIITYTSGSTGVPKGSIIRHDSYRNFCEFSPPRWGVELGVETVLQQSSCSFDLSIGQILVCLCYGGTLVVPADSQRRDPAAICNLLIQESITFTIATPTEYLAWLRHDNGRSLRSSRWRTAITAGESATDSLVQAFGTLANTEVRLFNVYGPSETTIGCADQQILPRQTVGKSSEDVFALSVLPNYSICVVDSNLKPVPVGVPGQILIGGAGVAAGYVTLQQGTTEAFIRNDRPSTIFKANEWLCAHLSGDRGSLDSHGRLILHGRVEDSTQIKLAGVRMDLQDIENTIVAMSPRILQAVVSRRVNPDLATEFLVAFLVMADIALEDMGDDYHLNRDTFLETIIRDLPLPHIMRPAIAVSVDALPMTISNKIDRTAVAKLSLNETARTTPNDEEGAVQLDDLEATLLCLWKEVLPEDIMRIRNVRNRDTDFFASGGNSLSLLTLQSRIKERFNVSISIMSLFGASTLSQMANMLRDRSRWRSKADVEIVDWEQETALPADMLFTSSNLDPENHSRHESLETRTSGTVIILTGSTGFLGQRVLSQLLSDDKVSRVHCIAVRKPSEDLPEIFLDERVSIHRGDLRSKLLGLSDQAAANIFAEASAVVHCGANVSFLESYHSLRHTNLASTQEIARLSLPYRIPLHYVSTASVTQLTKATTWGPESVASFSPNANSLNGFGYKSTKWASEVFLEKVSKTLRLPVIVHRPTSITGEGAHETDLLGNVMHFSQKAKAVPDASSWQGNLDFVDVSTVARRVKEEVMKSIQGGERKIGSGSSIRYVYESGDEVIGAESLGSHMTVLIGQVPTVMPFNEWVMALGQAGMNPLLVKYLERKLFFLHRRRHLWGMDKYKDLEPWQAARKLHQLWDTYNGENSQYKPTTRTTENAESYAATALEFYFLANCEWDVILPN
ncbi:hypothetical protein G7054_g1177 [Neopestalotiopsis clavispora]|nr:hypothetical protein G7054_g1177 [Neopestalotiopsis clavispora]